MASKRLTERLAKYNYLYDTEELADAVPKQSADSTLSVGSITSEHNGKTSAGKTATSNTNPAASTDNNNVIEPERLPVKTLMENVSSYANGHVSSSSDVSGTCSMTNGQPAVENSGSKPTGSKLTTATTTSTACNSSRVGNSDSKPTNVSSETNGKDVSAAFTYLLSLVFSAFLLLYVMLLWCSLPELHGCCN